MRLNRPANRSAGFSLVELMIGIAIGLVLLVGLSSVYISSVRGGRTTTAANQLNQEMRALMDIMVNDIRRAGYWDASATGVVNPFTEPTTRPAISAGGACILYSYDAVDLGGASGVVDARDHFGFQLTGGGVVQAVVPGSLAGTDLACTSANWMDLTDSVATEVTQLTFDTIGSKCIAIEAATPTNQVQWTTTTAAGTDLACDALASNAPSPYPSDTTHQFVETRQINITLTANSRIDPALTATMTESVLVRANRITIP